MVGHDIIVVGASAGGVDALCQLVGDLPPDLPYCGLCCPSRFTPRYECSLQYSEPL